MTALRGRPDVPPPATVTSTAVSFFANVEQVPGDPILGLTEAYIAEGDKDAARAELAKLPAEQNGQPLSVNMQRRIAMAQAGLGDTAVGLGLVHLQLCAHVAAHVQRFPCPAAFGEVGTQVAKGGDGSRQGQRLVGVAEGFTEAGEI